MLKNFSKTCSKSSRSFSYFLLDVFNYPTKEPFFHYSVTPVHSIATFSVDADTQADMFQRINEQKATSRKTGQIYVRAIQHLKEVQRVLECLIYEMLLIINKTTTPKLNTQRGGENNE